MKVQALSVTVTPFRVTIRLQLQFFGTKNHRIECQLLTVGERRLTETVLSNKITRNRIVLFEKEKRVFDTMADGPTAPILIPNQSQYANLPLRWPPSRRGNQSACRTQIASGMFASEHIPLSRERRDPESEKVKKGCSLACSLCGRHQSVVLVKTYEDYYLRALCCPSAHSLH